MIYHEFLELMHTIVRQQSSAVLLADSTKASELAMEALGNAGDVYDACRDMIALQSDPSSSDRCLTFRNGAVSRALKRRRSCTI